MKDAIAELVARSKDCPELRVFHSFHKQHPEVLDFLVSEIQLRVDHGHEAFSFPSLWSYCRWKVELPMEPGETFKLNDHLLPFYSRAIIVLHPDFNGRCELRPSSVDEVFGLELDPVKRPGDYARRLQWADGTAIENGWRPTVPHVIHHAANLRPDIHTERSF